jgi:hypothetical protein
VSRALALIGAGFLVAHLAFLPTTLEDIDSVNFALGVREFRVADHQPHPPGYPVFIALGKVAHALPPLPGFDDAARPARELAIWGALFGAFAAWPLYLLFLAIDGDRGRSLAATLVALTAPLVWMTASRPMSDVPGWALATLAQACLATAWLRQDSRAPAPAGSHVPWLVAGGVVAGLSIGLRSQNAWLTLPLLLVVIANGLLARRPRGALASLAGFAVAVIAWLVPLIVEGGGLATYLGALGEQAGDDIAGVPMLLLQRSARGLAFALLHSFVEPWAAWPLAALVLALAAAGAVAVVLTSRRALLIVCAAWVPYAVFHLLFQETITTRYALPLVPAVAYLVVRGLALAGPRVATTVSIAIAVTALVITVPAQRAYARDGAPVFRALRDIAAQRTPHRLATHHMVARAIRGEPAAAGMLPTPLRHEWLEVVRYWRDGGTAPVWFLSAPWRTDLMLFDPASRRTRGDYQWTFDAGRFLGGVRPSDTAWYELREPGWMASEGWALTPETAGVATRDRRGPTRGGIDAWVRRRQEPAVLLVGGRNLGQPGQPDAQFDLRIDGRPWQTWIVRPGFFLREWAVPAGFLAGGDRFARLTIAASAVPQGDVQAAIEQFDLQPLDGIVVGFDRGWYEMEHDPTKRLTWRWAGERADLRVRTGGRDVTVTLRGESPLRYFDAPPEVAWRAGDRVLGRTSPGADFTWTVRVPAEALAASDGVLTLTTSRSFSPSERGENQDRRRLGLRIFEVDVQRTNVR